MSKYAFIDAQKASFPIRLLCRVFGVPESSYFDWDRTGRDRCAQRGADTAVLVEEIRKIHVDSEATFGSPRVHDALRKAGRTVTLRRVAEVMAKAGIVGLTGREHCTTTTRRDRMQAPFPDLVQRNFLPAAPDLVWQDIAPRLSIEAQPRVVELCLSRLNCTDPMRGGIEMYPGAPDAEDYCTMGFHVWAPGVNSAVLTAGHREYSTNPIWKHNGINIGGEIDAMYPQFAGASNEFIAALNRRISDQTVHGTRPTQKG